MDWSQSHPKLTKFVLSSLKLSQVNPKLIANVHEAMSTSDDIAKIECWYTFIVRRVRVPFLWESSAGDIFLATKLNLHTINFLLLTKQVFKGKVRRKWRESDLLYISILSLNFQILRGLKYIHSANVLHRFTLSFIIISILFSRPPLNPLIQTIHWFRLMIEVEEIFFFAETWNQAIYCWTPLVTWRYVTSALPE